MMKSSSPTSGVGKAMLSLRVLGRDLFICLSQLLVSLDLPWLLNVIPIPHLHRTAPCVSASLHAHAAIRTQAYWIRAHATPVSPYFQIRSHSQVLDFGLQHVFCGGRHNTILNITKDNQCFLSQSLHQPVLELCVNEMNIYTHIKTCLQSKSLRSISVFCFFGKQFNW